MDNCGSAVVTLQCQASLLPRLAQALSALGEAGSARVLQQASGALLNWYLGKHCQTVLDRYVLLTPCAGSRFPPCCLAKVLKCFPCASSCLVSSCVSSKRAASVHSCSIGCDATLHWAAGLPGGPGSAACCGLSSAAAHCCGSVKYATVSCRVPARCGGANDQRPAGCLIPVQQLQPACPPPLQQLRHHLPALEPAAGKRCSWH